MYGQLKEKPEVTVYKKIIGNKIHVTTEYRTQSGVKKYSYQYTFEIGDKNANDKSVQQ